MTQSKAFWHSLRFRLVASAVLVEFIMLSALVWNSVELSKTALIEQTDHRIQNEVLPLLNASLAGPVLNEDIATISDLLKRIVTEQGLTYVGVRDSAGQVLHERGTDVRDPHPDESFSKHMTFEDARYVPYGGTQPITLGSREVGTFEYAVDTSFLHRAINRVQQEGIYIAALEIILSVLILSVAAYVMTRQLYRLIDASTRIAEGDMSVRVPVKGNDEIAQTSKAFNNMAAQTAERTESLKLAIEEQTYTAQALRESEKHFRTLIETASAIPWELDLNTWQFTYVGPQAEAMFGYPVEQWYTEGFWANHLHIEDRDEAVRFCMHETQQCRDHNFEYRMMTADGRTIWIRDIVNVITEGATPVKLSGFMFDVTTRKHNEAELEKHREHLEELVVERTEDLNKATEVAVAANKAKSEFLSRMSHELRTPLNAVLGFTQLLELKVKDNDDLQSHVKEIVVAGEHLLSLIDEVLDLARIDAGKIAVNPEHIPIQALLEETIQFIKPQALEQNITVEMNACDPTLSVIADTTRLKEVFLNILSNAVKYNTEHGKVVVSCAQVDEMVEVSVLDTGIGLTEEQMKNIFEPFSRLGAEFTGIHGTGIGLTIVKRLVELMQGSIRMESEQGKGTVFIISLPWVKQS